MLATDCGNLELALRRERRERIAVQNKLNAQRREDPRHDDIRAVVDHWKLVCNHPNAVVEPTADDDRWEAVRRRVEQFSVAELRQAVNGAARFPYLVNKQRRAQGDRKQRYDDLELVCRNPRNVQKFMDLALDDDGEPVDVAPHEPVVNARLFEEAINEAAHLRHLLEVQRDMIELEAHVNEGLLREIAEMRNGVLA